MKPGSRPAIPDNARDPRPAGEPARQATAVEAAAAQAVDPDEATGPSARSEQLDALRRRIEELEPLARTGQQIAGLRHDLNNRLTAITGTAELLMIREKTLSEDGRRRLETILECCRRILSRLEETREGGVPGAGSAATSTAASVE